MNLTNDSSETDNEKNSSSDEDEDTENTLPNTSSIYIKNFFSNNDNNEEFDSTDDDDDDDESDIENNFSSNNQCIKQNRLCRILRQSNPLNELKLNIVSNQNSSLRSSIIDNDISKQSNSNSRYSTGLRRLYLPCSSIYEFQSHITNWLEASTCLIDSISTSTYHRRCWSQLLLTYFIEQRFINLEFIICTNSLSSTTTTTFDHNFCSIHQYACIPEEDAYKLCSILQKGSRFNIDSNIFDHIRRIIIIKSMQEAYNDNTNLQQLYLKQLTSLKQSLMNMDNNNLSINIGTIYSKVLLFLSSLYSIKAETMQTLFCQHLLHNPMYSYLITS